MYSEPKERKKEEKLQQSITSGEERSELCKNAQDEDAFVDLIKTCSGPFLVFCQSINPNSDIDRSLSTNRLHTLWHAQWSLDISMTYDIEY